MLKKKYVEDINNLLKNAFENIRLIVLEVLNSNSFRNKWK